jgi:hypothetical protein
MIMAYWGFIIFMALFASNANELANWQLTVPAKEHISSYQIVSDNWKMHYSINGNEYQYYLKLTQDDESQKKLEEKTFVVLSNTKDLTYQTVFDSLISSQYKNSDDVFYWLGYE